MSTVFKLGGLVLLMSSFASCNTQKEAAQEVVIQEAPPAPPTTTPTTAPTEPQATPKSATPEPVPVFKTQELQMNRKPALPVGNGKSGK